MLHVYHWPAPHFILPVCPGPPRQRNDSCSHVKLYPRTLVFGGLRKCLFWRKFPPSCLRPPTLPSTDWLRRGFDTSKATVDWLLGNQSEPLSGSDTWQSGKVGSQRRLIGRPRSWRERWLETVDRGGGWRMWATERRGARGPGWLRALVVHGRRGWWKFLPRAPSAAPRACNTLLTPVHTGQASPQGHTCAPPAPWVCASGKGCPTVAFPRGPPIGLPG